MLYNMDNNILNDMEKIHINVLRAIAILKCVEEIRQREQ